MYKIKKLTYDMVDFNLPSSFIKLTHGNILMYYLSDTSILHYHEELAYQILEKNNTHNHYSDDLMHSSYIKISNTGTHKSILVWHTISQDDLDFLKTLFPASIFRYEMLLSSNTVINC